MTVASGLWMGFDRSMKCLPPHWRVRCFCINKEHVAEMAGSSCGESTKRKSESRGYFSEEEDNEEDDEYVPPDPWRRNVRQGPFYQASIPSFISTNVEYPC